MSGPLAMSSVASAEPIPAHRLSTSSRRDDGPQPTDSPHRAASLQSRTATAQTSSTPTRAASTSQAAALPPSSSRQAQHLANVARRDGEQSNVARSNSQTRRSSSMDRYGVDRPRDRSTGAPRTSTHSRNASATRTSSRYNADAPQDAPVTNGVSTEQQARPVQPAAPATAAVPRKRTMVTAQTGHWNLGKTIGAGSMGKVKLAKNQETGETVAIKIVPRYSQEGEHKSREDRERADHSKEIRTAREAAIVTLVKHPFICGMRDVVRTNYHWYMLFEYVNGGQMLDYIISHGRLKEKQARKFGRQIASALDYCHRNSIVHRDLKIENILISKTGDIKIIDFGLSNLYSPKNLLKTFCGSLYFAAPELLQARQYTGPEVDVWSFGIVLYVLVCGKVPFDDQSMPQLHAKIKKGAVEYPPWLSHECKHIISRMLVTDPRQRAPLSEIINHPWMTKGFNGPPENHLPVREPLHLPLDPQVIDKMTGFDFGSAEYITRQLEKIVSSEDYQRAVRLSNRKKETHVTEHDKRRSSVFDFYQRRKSATSRDTLTHSSSDTLPLGEDPVNAFSPLLSVYYLVREKQEREKQESNPGALAMPQSPGQKPLKLPDVPTPESSVPVLATNPNEESHDRSRPRWREQAEDEKNDDVQSSNGHDPQTPLLQTPSSKSPAKTQNGVGGILRKFSTRRNRESDNEQPRPPTTPTVAVSKPSESIQGTPRGSISVRRTREQPPSAYHDVANRHPDLLAPPSSSGEASVKKSSKGGLGRSISVNSADLRRRWSLRRGNSENQMVREKTVPSQSDRSSMIETPSHTIESQSDTEHSMRPNTRPSNRGNPSSSGRRDSTHTKRMRAAVPAESDVPEETDAELAEEYSGNARGNESHETMKPVYLKGLFSVSTTSSRPLSYIRTDIIRVLTQLGVDFKEVKSGFSCRHLPSIDLNKVVDPEKPESRPQSNRRRISFAALRSPDKERANPVDEQASQQHGNASRGTPRRGATESNYTTNSEEESEEDDDKTPRPRSNARAAGETTTHVQSDLGQSMVLRFEIKVIKVPILSLHGLQFKKLEGGTWQYKRMAETILNELRL